MSDIVKLVVFGQHDSAINLMKNQTSTAIVFIFLVALVAGIAAGILLSDLVPQLITLIP